MLQYIMEFDNPAFEEEGEPTEEETSFIDPPDDPVMWENDTEIPQWAGGKEVPASLLREDLATPSQTMGLVERWQREVSKRGLQVKLEFRSSTRGDLWVKWGNKWLLLTWKNRPSKFLSPLTLNRYGIQLARALGVADEVELDPKMATLLQTVDTQLGAAAAHTESVELRDLDPVAKEASDAAHVLETSLTDTDELLGTTPIREIRGLDRALQRIRGELTNNLAKLSELDEHIAQEQQKLNEAGGDVDEFARRRIAERLRDLQDERASRLEAAAANREALRSQISRMRETISRILNEDTTLAERVRTLFREQGVTIASILTAIGMAISTLVLALTGGGSGAVPPAPTPPDKKGLADWVKKHLQSLGRALAKLAGKAAAALPGIIGSVVSWLLNLLAKSASWLAEHLWAVVVGVGGLLLVATREWLAK